MKILIACEHSGIVREAFRARGHDAYSCDLFPASDGSIYHLRGDVLKFLKGWDLMKWDAMIAHPPCTYLATCAAWAFKDPDFVKYPGVGYHQKVKPGTLTGAARREAREKAKEFVLALWNCGIPRIAIENPVGVLSSILGQPQTLHPYQFGDDASKATCLWFKGLPPLSPTKYCKPRLVCKRCSAVAGLLYGDGHACPACGMNNPWLRRWSNQTDSGQNKLSPSDLRGHLRSLTYPGIARAMAEQWGTEAAAEFRLTA